MPQDFSRLTRFFAALVGVLILAGCGGGGNGGNPNGGGNPPPPPSGATVTVSGRVTFDRLQFQTVQGAGLNALTPVVSPAREVTVEAVSGTTVSASTSTDSNGNYSLAVPANSNVFIRVRAQMVKTGSAPTWNFAVRNNTNSDAMYVLDGDSFATGTTAVTRDLHAPSGWNGTSYGSTRAAAPFAILDTVYRAKELIRTAAPNAAFPDLNLYWSTSNRDNAAGFCPDTGDIGTSFYFSDPTNSTNDRCSPAQPLPTGIYILGEYRGANAGDTDEFDAHVIAHEFGHYFEDRFSRSDSIGGSHGIGERLDPRLAFGEGWGNAFGAMSLNDPQYRDSGSGISSDFGFDLETGTTLAEGWFSESSVGEILWDVFDTSAESGDNVTLGFAPIYAVMTDAEVNTNAFTSIFSFASALRANNSGQSPAIGALLTREEISGSGDFGNDETNNGGDNGFGGVYRDIAINQPAQTVCSTVSASGNEDGNKLGNRQFLRFVKNSDGAVAIRADGTTSSSVPGSGIAQDPDILVYQRGVLRLSGESSNQAVELIPATPLAAGTYVIEVYAFEVVDPDETQRVSTPRCMNISISGT
jgi:hypothetical protein